jgi:hypothetical protein
MMALMDAETPRKSTQLARPKLVRLVMTGAAQVTYKELAKQAKKTKPPTATPKTLELSEIHVAPTVFQWRQTRRNIMASDLHTLDLARALQGGNAPFDPLLVYLIGDKYYVLEGHHRVDAYRTVRWTNPVPVQVFSGTLEEACAAALELNSHNKLPMTREDKGEAAWKLTKTMPHLSIEEVHRLSTVSKRNVSYMRKRWKELCERFRRERSKKVSDQESKRVLPYESLGEMREQLTWAQARAEWYGLDSHNEDWWEDEVEKMTKLLGTHVGFKLMRHPDVTAEALRKLHPELPRKLIYEWATQEWETIKELMEAHEEEIEF